MSGIAEIMSNLGYTVTGSDINDGEACRRLRQLGIKVNIGHDVANIGNADAVVFSSAVAPSNPEIAAARAQQIPVVPRATMLAELLRLRKGIAVAGSHGKTTITSLVASILGEAGMDPTYIIGGKLLRIDSASRLGSGDFIVVEADESDASFLRLNPVVAVVSNIDNDHLDNYSQDFRRLKRAFIEFIENLPFYGAAVVCFDDANARDCATMVSKPVRSYGVDCADTDFSAHNIRQEKSMLRFSLKSSEFGGEFTLKCAGRHNVCNALAAIAVCAEIGVGEDEIKRGLENFAGVGRRLESHGTCSFDRRSFELIDDYGHHPTEIAATIGAVRDMHPGRRLVLFFQPHRYTRTRDCFGALVDSLGGADVLLLAEIHAAGEERLPNADGEALAHAIRVSGRVEPVFVPSLDDAVERLEAVVQDGDVVVTMGAGAISSLAGSIKGAAQ